MAADPVKAASSTDRVGDGHMIRPVVLARDLRLLSGERRTGRILSVRYALRRRKNPQSTERRETGSAQWYDDAGGIGTLRGEDEWPSVRGPVTRDYPVAAAPN